MNSASDNISIVVKDAIIHFLTIDPRTWGRFGVEIEAKLGHLTHGVSGIPLRDITTFSGPTLIDPAYPARFVSGMSKAQHRAFNKHLNREVDLCDPAHPQHREGPVIRYKHTKVTDSIYKSYMESGLEIKPRVTTDDNQGGKVVESISKENIAHMQICCPDDPFDIRLSINIEHKIPEPTHAKPKLQRKKDRMSYKWPTHQIDLTKVLNEGTKQQSYESFELEVELVDMENLKHQADLELDDKPNSLDDIVRDFVSALRTLNNIRSIL